MTATNTEDKIKQLSTSKRIEIMLYLARKKKVITSNIFLIELFGTLEIAKSYFTNNGFKLELDTNVSNRKSDVVLYTLELEPIKQL